MIWKLSAPLDPLDCVGCSGGGKHQYKGVVVDCPYCGGSGRLRRLIGRSDKLQQVLQTSVRKVVEDNSSLALDDYNDRETLIRKLCIELEIPYAQELER